LDFEYHYTEEQERFRGEVRAWLDGNLPQGLASSAEASSLDEATWEKCRAFQRQLGEKGWLAPAAPVEWGGGGLTSDHALVLIEELGGRGLQWLLEPGASPLQSALRQWGTEEQKGQYLSALSRGQATVWHLALDPEVELDTDSLGVHAFLEGDDYLLTGQGTFFGLGPRPDYLWALAITDPDGPPQKSTATFLVPAALEGIAIHTPTSLLPGEAHTVTFDKVWVPSHCLLGEEGDGWSVMETSMAMDSPMEHPLSHDENVGDLIKYATENSRYGVAISKQPFFQQLLMEVYVNSEVIRVFRTRNAWMASTGQKLTYQTAQTELLEKKAALRLSQVVREIMGVYAMLGPEDPLAPMQGKFQLHQRRSLVQQSPVGSLDGQAAAIVKHLGFDPIEGKGPESVPHGTASGISPSQ
jgi:alkylation response protein AidB-like acyl-CoA dehydrogenase